MEPKYSRATFRSPRLKETNLQDAVISLTGATSATPSLTWLTQLCEAQRKVQECAGTGRACQGDWRDLAAEHAEKRHALRFKTRAARRKLIKR